MTTKADFTEQEWKDVLGGPPAAAMIVILAQRGGSFRETWAIGKTYAEARQKHGASELLDEIVAAKPEVDHSHYAKFDDVEKHGLEHVQSALDVLKAKATPREIDDYRDFVVTLVEHVAHAHREHGADVSPAEQSAIDDIKATLGGDGAT